LRHSGRLCTSHRRAQPVQLFDRSYSNNEPHLRLREQSRQSAIDSKVDGIAVTLAKPDAMAAGVQAAIAAGIPVVGLNSGFDAWQKLRWRYRAWRQLLHRR
jgi:hypothetical protein